jgi:mannosyltransferase OCH1-like enzyme
MTCIPPNFWTDPSITTVVGIEIDEPSADEAVQRKWKWSRNHGFTQWTVISKPFAEPLKLAIVRAISHTYALARLRGVSEPGKLRSGKGIFDWFLGSYTVKDILEITGPGMWTDSVLDSINRRNAQRSGRVSWYAFTGLEIPKVVGHVLVLPINYFGSGQRHSEAGNFQVPEACVNHLAKRTWK